MSHSSNTLLVRFAALFAAILLVACSDERGFKPKAFPALADQQTIGQGQPSGGQQNIPANGQQSQSQTQPKEQQSSAGQQAPPPVNPRQVQIPPANGQQQPQQPSASNGQPANAQDEFIEPVVRDYLETENKGKVTEDKIQEFIDHMTPAKEAAAVIEGFSLKRMTGFDANRAMQFDLSALLNLQDGQKRLFASLVVQAPANPNDNPEPQVSAVYRTIDGKVTPADNVSIFASFCKGTPECQTNSLLNVLMVIHDKGQPIIAAFGQAVGDDGKAFIRSTIGNVKSFSSVDPKLKAPDLSSKPGASTPGVMTPPAAPATASAPASNQTELDAKKAEAKAKADAAAADAAKKAAQQAAQKAAAASLSNQKQAAAVNDPANRDANFKLREAQKQPQKVELVTVPPIKPNQPAPVKTVTPVKPAPAKTVVATPVKSAPAKTAALATAKPAPGKVDAKKSAAAVTKKETQSKSVTPIKTKPAQAAAPMKPDSMKAAVPLKAAPAAKTSVAAKQKPKLATAPESKAKPSSVTKPSSQKKVQTKKDNQIKPTQNSDGLISI